MSRILALLGAAALVLGAMVVRSAIDSGDDGGDSGDGEGAGGAEIVCGTPLAAACERLAEEVDSEGGDLEVTVEPEADTLDRLASGDLVLGASVAWLAAGPWPEMAAAAGTDIGTPSGTSPLGRSEAVIVGLDERLAAARTVCPELDWACIGEAAGGPWTDLGGAAAWGRVEVALPDPRAGDGTVAVNQAVASRLGTPDFSLTDLEDDPAAVSWFDRLAAESGANTTATSPLTRFLTVPGSLGVVGALRAEATTLLASAAVADEVGVVAPEPRMAAVVRLWAADQASLEEVRDTLGVQRLRAALAATGWDRAGDEGAGDEGNLPPAGTLVAVDGMWEEAR